MTAASDPGHHLHQQGRRGDEGAGGPLLGASSRWMWVCTFHSACARILRQDAVASRLPDRTSPSTTRTTRSALSSTAWRTSARPQAVPSQGSQPHLRRQEQAGGHRRFRAIRHIGHCRSRDGGDGVRWLGLHRRRGSGLPALPGAAARANALDFDDLLMRTVDVLRLFPSGWPTTATSSATCWWTSTRTPTGPSTSW